MSVLKQKYNSSAHLDELIHQVRSLIDSSENRRRLALQSALHRREKVFAFNSWSWGGGTSVGDAKTPVPGMSIRDMALKLGDVDSGFAQAVIERQLQSQISFFDMVDSDVPVATQVFSNLGLSWLYTQNPIGEICEVLPDTGAFIHLPVLKESCQEWTMLSEPVFQVDEALHNRRMKVYSELTDGSFPLLDDLIPLPIGSVFGTASRLRGDSDVLMDFIECPDSVHALMRFLTDAAREYNMAHAAFMKNDQWSRVRPEGGDYLMYIFTSVAAMGGRQMYIAGEDHVSANMFSEEHFLEFIFPYQKELLQEFPEWYVHSCGNLTPLYKHIAKLPNLNRVHVSPWSNLEAAVEALGNSVVLEIHHSLDFDEMSGEEIDRMADHLVEVCGGACTLDIVLPQSENGKRYKQRILSRMG